MTHPASRGGRTGVELLMRASTVGTCGSTVFALVGLLRPSYVQPGSLTTSLARFWAASSAVRTLALTCALLRGDDSAQRPAPQLLVVAGTVQLLDAVLGLWQRNVPMAVLPALVGMLHLASARVLATNGLPEPPHDGAGSQG